MSKFRLELSYEDYVKNKKSIADCQIGDYVVYERLDGGAFGTVYRGMHRHSGKEVAVKLIDLAAIERDDCSSRVKQIRRRLAKTESEMMMKINSTNVMKCYATYENKWLKIMIVEYCNGGTLAQEIFSRGRIPEAEALEILKQLMSGISAMHQENIIHRDLKADNIMSHNGVYKIVDLGFAKMIPNSETYHTTLGTIITMAPQVMRKQKYGLKADIWSIGIIFYEMVYGKIPYEPMKAPEMYEQIIQKNIFPNNGYVNGYRPAEPTLALMKRILVIDQKQRMGWEELLSQQIFRPAKQLPENYRMTTNIDKLKKEVKVNPRDDEQVFQDLHKDSLLEEKEKKEPVMVSKLKNKEKEKLIGKVDKSEDALLQWARDTHLQCLKTETILKNIITLIEVDKILPPKERSTVELMYLLSTRCFFNMSFVKDKVENDQHEIVQNLKRTVEELYQSVQFKLKFYSEALTQVENKLGSMISDRWSRIFSSSKIKTKDKFLVGIENIEFTKQEQIVYTYQAYIKPIIEDMSPAEKKEHPDFMKYFNNYQKINMITLNSLKKKNYREYVEEIINEK